MARNNIATATRRVRTTKGECYLTHGSDTYNKHGLRKARRILDTAIVEEQLDETITESTIPRKTVTFRLVITTQVYENYGYRMKSKGGSEYHVPLGNAMDVINLGKAGIDRLISKVSEKVERFATEEIHSYDEYIIGCEIVPSNELTYEEEMHAEYAGYYGQEWTDRQNAALILELS